MADNAYAATLAAATTTGTINPLWQIQGNGNVDFDGLAGGYDSVVTTITVAGNPAAGTTAAWNGGQTDNIIWRATANVDNYTAGQVGYWGANSQFIPIGGPVDPAQWKIVGMGDFNGTGFHDDDILWQNLQTGQLGYWQVGPTVTNQFGTGASVADFVTFTNPNPTPGAGPVGQGLTVLGTGNFDHGIAVQNNAFDIQDDEILVMDNATRGVYVMSPNDGVVTNHTQNVFFSPLVTTLTANQSVVGTGNFNADAWNDANGVPVGTTAAGTGIVGQGTNTVGDQRVSDTWHQDDILILDKTGFTSGGNLSVLLHNAGTFNTNYGAPIALGVLSNGSVQGIGNFDDDAVNATFANASTLNNQPGQPDDLAIRDNNGQVYFWQFLGQTGGGTNTTFITAPTATAVGGPIGPEWQLATPDAALDNNDGIGSGHNDDLMWRAVATTPDSTAGQVLIWEIH